MRGARRLLSLVGKLTGARELITGDAAFDDGVYVQGWPPLVHTLLDAETHIWQKLSPGSGPSPETRGSSRWPPASPDS